MAERKLMPRTVFSPSRRLYARSTRMVIDNMVRVAKMFHFTEVEAPHGACSGKEYREALVDEWQKSAYFLSLYPWVWPVTSTSFPAHKFPVLGTRDKYSMLYVDDLPLALLESFGDARAPLFAARERDFLGRQDSIMVFNEAMREWLLQQYDFDPARIISCDFMDYPVDFDPPAKKELRDRVRIASATGYIPDYIGDWIPKLPKSEILWEFYGPQGDWITELDRRDLRWHGEIEDPLHLARQLSAGAEFGMLMWAEKRRPYLKYGTGMKFSLYMAAGLPVLCGRGFEYPASVIEKMGLGLLFDDVRDIPSLIESLTQVRYDQMRTNCLMLGARMRRSEFFLTAMLKSFARSF